MNKNDLLLEIRMRNVVATPTFLTAYYLIYYFVIVINILPQNLTLVFGTRFQGTFVYIDSASRQ